MVEKQEIAISGGKNSLAAVGIAISLNKIAFSGF